MSAACQNQFARETLPLIHSMRVPVLIAKGTNARPLLTCRRLLDSMRRLRRSVSMRWRTQAQFDSLRVPYGHAFGDTWSILEFLAAVGRDR